ncbi:MAG: helix-turn-helix domain-containing protein [Mariprofundales bacterium]
MITVEVGQRLAQARTEQQMSLEDISNQLKLHTGQLQALESGDWSLLPHDALATGFLRQYANLLAVDVEETLTRLKSDAFNVKQPLTFPDPGIAPNRKWAIAAAVLFVILFIAWNVMDHRTETAPQPIPETPQIEASKPTILPPITPKHQPEPPLHAPATKAENVPTIDATQQPAPSSKPLPTPSIVPIAGKQVAPYQEREKAQIAPKSAEITPQIPTEHATAAHMYRFIAGNERVWLNVSLLLADGSSQTYRDVILRPTHSIEINRDEDSLLFSCGNAGALKIEVDGITRFDFGQLGPRGMVLRHHTITAVTKK